MHRRTLSSVTAALLVIAAIAGAPLAVSADDGGGALDGFLEDDEDDGVDWSATAQGVLNKNLWQASQYLSISDTEEDEQEAERDRADLQEAFNANNESIEAYANDRFGGNETEWDVIAVEHVRGEGDATHYLVADVENDSFANARMVNDTERDIDHRVTLRGYASDSAHDELDRFVEEYVANDSDVTTAYTTRLAAEYSGYVDRPEALTDD